MSESDFGSPEFARSGCGCLVGLVLVVLAIVVAVEPNVTWVETRAPRSTRDTERVCPGELLLACQRMEGGEVPAQVLGTAKPEEMRNVLRACTKCGDYPRISGTLLPAAEELETALDGVRAQMRP